jgi:hypothetical protein
MLEYGTIIQRRTSTAIMFMASKSKGKDILGIDCGEVIFKSLNGEPVPGSFDNIKKIVDSGHFERVYVVSKINPMLRFTFRGRLWYFNFWKYTGIPRQNLYFCRRHEDKAAICEYLGVTHFVDDRLRVLNCLKTVDNRFALNPKLSQRQLRKYPDALKEVTVVESWQELSPLLLMS